MTKMGCEAFTRKVVEVFKRSARGSEHDSIEIDGREYPNLDLRIVSCEHEPTHFDTDHIFVEVQCPCCEGFSHLSVQCQTWSCDHEIECPTCEGDGWLRLIIELDADDPTYDIVRFDNEHWEDAAVDIPSDVLQRYYQIARVTGEDRGIPYVDPNQVAMPFEKEEKP